MTTIAEQMIELQDAIIKNKYYIDDYFASLAHHGMRVSGVDASEYTHLQIIEMCNTFWLRLPKSMSARRVPFNQLCEIAEKIFDE